MLSEKVSAMALLEKIGSVFGINTNGMGESSAPVVSTLDNGGFVVAWDWASVGIVGQLYDDQGFRSGGEFAVSTANVNRQSSPDIATLSDGTYRNALNKSGGYQNAHLVYDREGDVCPSCRKGEVQRIVQAQRSTFFCVKCQRVSRKR
jgi:hypothetical protein